MTATAQNTTAFHFPSMLFLEHNPNPVLSLMSRLLAAGRESQA